MFSHEICHPGQDSQSSNLDKLYDVKKHLRMFCHFYHQVTQLIKKYDYKKLFLFMENVYQHYISKMNYGTK